MSDRTSLFWAKVDKTDSCWGWTGATGRNGYGVFRIDSRKTAYAHRLSWEMENGPITTGMFVCHHCDNRRCVRPDHLFLGTHQDNMNDMWAKGRQRDYSLHRTTIGWRKLDPDKVRAIRASDEPNVTLARRYDVDPGAIRQVRLGKTWAWVTSPA